MVKSGDELRETLWNKNDQSEIMKKPPKDWVPQDKEI